MSRRDQVPGEAVRLLLEYATSAPSVRNAQPWAWRVAGGMLWLSAGRDRQSPDTDPDGRALLFGCGAALHHLRVAGAALGRDVRVGRLPDPLEPELLAVTEFRSSISDTERATALAREIARRRNNPRRYLDQELSVEEADELCSGECARGGVHVRVADAESRAILLPAIAEADRRKALDPAVLAETFGDPPPRPAPPDGLGTLLVLTTARDSRLDRLRAGEAVSEVLLTAAKLGLAACPRLGPLDVGDTRGELSRLLGGDVVPQALIRVGHPAEPDVPLPHRPSRELAEVVRFG